MNPHRREPRSLGWGRNNINVNIDNANGPSASTQVDSGETLRAHLQELQTRDPYCVLVVRKINRFGFNSAHVLRQHFSQHGPVDTVLVAHSQVKCPNRRSAARLRPSGLGFVVMADVADAEAVIAMGKEHRVSNELIRVHRYTSRTLDGADDKDDDDDAEEEEVLESTRECEIAETGGAPGLSVGGGPVGTVGAGVVCV